jgi:hypothetical protein
LKAFLYATVLSWVVLSNGVVAQTTTFTYQGKLTDNGSPATGSYQMEFKLFNAVSGGSQLGGTLADIPVTAAGGVFAVQLDFGASPFTGAGTWLEIGVRHNSGEVYSVLPREQITSSPFAIRTLSAASADVALDSQKLGGVAASQYLTTANVGTSAIRNQVGQQAGAGFNIDGNGAIAGSLGIGTQAPNGKLSIANAPAWTTDVWGGAIELQNGAAVGWQANASSQRQGIGHTNAGLMFFRTLSDIGSTANGPIYDMKLDNSGRLGIGAIGLNTALTSQIEVFAQNGLGINGFQPYLSLRDTAASSKESFVQGVNGDVVLLTNGRQSLQLKDVSGNIGIGTATPAHRLDINGGPPWTSVSWNGAIALNNFSAIAWKPNEQGKSFGIGQQSGGMFVFNSPSAPGGTASPPNYLLEVTNSGDIYQQRSQGGLAKAMVVVGSNGTILRCYNGVTGNSTGNCGFVITEFVNTAVGALANRAVVDFGFKVDDRFAAASIHYTNINPGGSSLYYFQNTIGVEFFTDPIQDCTVIVF